MAAGGRRSGRIIIILALLLIVGLGAVVFLFRDQLLQANQPQAVVETAVPEQKMVAIVITTQFVPRGTSLGESVLTTVPYPEDGLVEGTFYTNIADAVGKQAKYDLDARIPLTSSLIVDSQVGSFAAFQIPRGMVAISIPISRLTAVSFAPLPGDHVNLIASIMLTDLDATYQARVPNKVTVVSAPDNIREDGVPDLLTIDVAPDGGQQGRVELDPTLNHALYVGPSEVQRPRPVSQTLIQDAIVLHVGSFLDGNGDYVTDSSAAKALPTPTPAPEGQTEEQAPVTKPFPEEITLVVSPQDAVTLNYLMLIGAKLNLALRSAGDSEKIQTEAVTLQFLMDQYAIPNPTKLPFGIEPRKDCLAFPGETCQGTPITAPPAE